MIPLSEIYAARAHIAPPILTTPVTFDLELGVWLKWENRQITGSFKSRGALNKVLSLTPEQRAAGLVTASAGNHGQGVALVAQRTGAPVTVYVSEGASPLKVAKMRAMGAEVVLVPGRYGEAEAGAIRAARAQGRTYVSAYNDPAVMAGAGTIGLELWEQIPGLARVVIPAGGGGLLAGVGSALKQLNPAITVVAVQNETSAYLWTKFHGGDMAAVVETDSLADGLSGAVEPGSASVPLMHEVTDDFLLVSEAKIARAMKYFWERLGERVEGSGAVGLAALLAGKLSPGPVTALVVSGGNVDDVTFRRVLQE
ncbi:MAG: threonine/serine dehydratase [Chloroflexi bacterium]|nr:threonine/serine dehydratase [Chloroflexota bacterium]